MVGFCKMKGRKGRPWPIVSIARKSPTREKTVEQLYKMQYYVNEKPRMILRALIGFGLVAAAVLSSLSTWARRCCFL